MKIKKLIKILGYGSVVKQFLIDKRDSFPEIQFEIYQRSSINNNNVSKNVLFRDISSYVSDDNLTFCCCSIDEESLLRESSPNLSRLQVAIPNLQLIMQFVNAGYFTNGKYFILTNPSDLVAEVIIRRTKNKNVYGLGLSMDRHRYNKILFESQIDPAHNQFDLVGNHWDSPLINFSSNSIYNHVDFLKEIMAKLKNNVKSEFCGYKPPVKSGAQVLFDAIYKLYNNEKLEVSGFLDERDTVAGGILNTETFEFYQPSVNPIANTLLQGAIHFHKKTYNDLAGKIG
jgi:hypothetical protein